MGWFYLFFFFATFLAFFLAAIHYPPSWKIFFRESANLLGPGAFVAPYVVVPVRIVKQNLHSGWVSAPPPQQGFAQEGVP